MGENVLLIQVDGKLPNLALMKLAHWHRSRGDTVRLTHEVRRGLFTGNPDRVYASVVFTKSFPKVLVLKDNFPECVIGGTGLPETMGRTVEMVIGVDRYEHYDYTDYPGYEWSLGFTQRGCRLACEFCVVPKKEGRPVPVNTIADIWREGTPRCVVLLDNDFFGQPASDWQARIKELQEGRFRVCFNQGINIRLVNDEVARALASIEYRDDQFTRRRLYTAWDQLGQERIFFRGLEKLEAVGIPAKQVMVYMLVGFDPAETMADVEYRHRRLEDAGCMPYPMVFDNKRTDLREFQRWVIQRYDEVVPFDDYDPHYKKPQVVPEQQMPLLAGEE